MDGDNKLFLIRTEIPSLSTITITETLGLIVIVLYVTTILYIHSVEAVVSGKYNFVGKWGTRGTGNGQFQYPIGTAADSSGFVYVADSANDRIQKFRLANPCPVGTTQIVTGVCFVTKWGMPGTGNGQFKWPAGIAIDPAGLVYVTDYLNFRVQVFTSNGVFIRAWGSQGSADGQFNSAGDIATDTLGYVYVSDMLNDRVQKFLLSPTCPPGTTQITADVCFVTKWGNTGVGDGQFIVPTGVAVDSSTGRIYVGDNNNHRIQAFFWKPLNFNFETAGIIVK